MQHWRRMAGLALVIAALAAGAVVVVQLSAGPRHPAGVITGSFELTTHDGRRLSGRDLSGKPYVGVFGYTQCPDVCPTTLQDLGNLISGLGPDAGRLQFLFFTVDPERDTEAVLKSYLSAFDPRIVGLTGTLDEVSAAAKSFRAFFRKEASSGSYTMSHTASVYLMDGRGALVSTLSLQDGDEKWLASVRGLLKSVPAE